jgi:hypothetical protein
MSALFLGSVAHTLARLAAADGDPAAARDHARAALERHRAAGLAPWVARTQDVLARLPR